MGATLITSNAVKVEDLREIELPEKTHSYQPVSHVDFIDNVKDIAGKMLPNRSLDSEKYGIAREGKQLFGTMTFKKPAEQGMGLEEMVEDIGLSIGIRNSYDKSMSLGLAVGATVFVCENLMITGEITVMRKHQGAILDELNTLIFKALVDAENKFKTLHADSQQMKEVYISNKDAYRMMGRLYGYGIIGERQLPVVKNEWKKPSHEVFNTGTAWTLYNAGTEALKKTAPLHRMDRQIKLHKTFANEYALNG